MASVVELYDKFTAGFADKAGKPPVSVCSLVITPRPAFPGYHPPCQTRRASRPSRSRKGANPNPSPNPNPNPAPNPEQVEEGSEHAYLMAHFHKARALGKLQGLESLRGSLASYQLLVQYFDANPKVRVRDRLRLRLRLRVRARVSSNPSPKPTQCAGMAEEAEICREMAELLPRRIDMEASKLAKAKA